MEVAKGTKDLFYFFFNLAIKNNHHGHVNRNQR